MIRRIITYFICLILSNSLLFFEEISSINGEFDNLEQYVSTMCLMYKETEQINVIYNYEMIYLYLDNQLNKCELIEVSESEFMLNCSVKKGVFYKEINEKFLIRKGDMYDGRS